MALKRFNMKTLCEMDDGRVATMLETLIDRLVEDCRDRPGVKDKRKVTLQILLEPTRGERGVLEGVDVSFKIDDKIPSRCSILYTMRDDGQGPLWFNDLSADNPDQMTVDQVPGVESDDPKTSNHTPRLRPNQEGDSDAG